MAIDIKSKGTIECDGLHSATSISADGGIVASTGVTVGSSNITPASISTTSISATNVTINDSGYNGYTNLKSILTNIDSRLDSLGFKSGSVTGISNATLKKQGKYAILSLNNTMIMFNNMAPFTMSTGFTPKTSFSTTLGNVGTTYGASGGVTFTFSAGSNTVTIKQSQSSMTSGGQYATLTGQIGFEVQ